MSPVDLLKECERATSQGLSRMVLTIPRRKRRLRSNRIRVMPGVIGTYCGGVDDRLLVWVEVADVVRALERVMFDAATEADRLLTEQLGKRAHTLRVSLDSGRTYTCPVVSPDLPSGPMAHDGDEPEPCDGKA